MIRRSTWIVFMAFIVISVAAIFLLKSPASPLQPAGQTPSPTAAPRLIEDTTAEDVVGIELVQVGTETIRLMKQADGRWINETTQALVDKGTIEQILSEVLATRVLLVMPADYSLTSLSLTTPGQTITVTRSDGRSLKLIVGGLTPTGNGYYVRVDEKTPVVVSKYALDAVTQLFGQVNAPTPTPEVPIESGATSTPAP